MGMGKPRVSKVPISHRALMQRINRALTKEDERLCKARPSRGEGLTREQLECGDYYVINTRGNMVTTKHVDIEALGRELEVLAEWESLAD